MELFPFSYVHAYAYVTPVHTYFSYFSYVYVYACAYAPRKYYTLNVWSRGTQLVLFSRES